MNIKSRKSRFFQDDFEHLREGMNSRRYDFQSRGLEFLSPEREHYNDDIIVRIEALDLVE